MAQTLRLRAPSGDRVVLSLPDTPKVSAIGTHATFHGPNFSQAIQTGGRGYHAEVCRVVVPATVRDRALHQGREVAVAISDDQHATVAGWIGPYHEAVIFFTGPVGGRAGVLRAFDYFVFDDAPDGLKITPTRLTGVDRATETFCVLVDRDTRVVVPGPPTARGMVPQHRGAKTRHGEVWRTSKYPDVLTGGERVRDYLYILGTAKGLAEISFDEHIDARDDTLLRWLDDVDVSWQ
jgi:hypothetical protein